MDDKTFKKITLKRSATKNILSLSTPGCNDGNNNWIVADEKLKGYAQGLIDNVKDHRHLKGSKILLLVKFNDSTRKKLEAGEKVVIGKASKASPKEKLLTAIGKTEGAQADFVIWLSGDWLDLLNEDEYKKKAVALIDHEMMHCGAKVAGIFVEESVIQKMVDDLSWKHIETCKDVRDDDDKILIRYYQTDKQGHLTWKMNTHDIEEFHSVIERHGIWKRDLCRLIDVIVKAENNLFSKAG